MWPFNHKSKYIKVPREWAEGLSELTTEATFGIGFNTDIKAHEVVGYASNIKNYF